MSDGNRKADQGKPKWSLVPFDGMEPVIRALEFGAEQYGAENWRNTDDPTRYFDAAMRHLVAAGRGEESDPDTGLPHEAHAVCCLLFILALNQPCGHILDAMQGLQCAEPKGHRGPHIAGVVGS